MQKFQIHICSSPIKSIHIKKVILSTFLAISLAPAAFAQKVKSADVSVGTRAALLKKYPDAVKATWEKEKGNYEANWGGKSGEDMSVQFTPGGSFY